MSFKVTKRDPVPVPTFTSQDMENLAMEADRSERLRIQRGVDVNDQPAKPLSARYQAQKTSRGLSPIRNLTNTGAMLQSRGPLQSSDNTVTIGFTNANEARKAAANERISPMLGISRGDQFAVDQRAQQVLDRKVKDI